MKSITIRFSDDLHKAMKLKLLESEEPAQQYIIRLIKEDLGFTKEESIEDYRDPKTQLRTKPE